MNQFTKFKNVTKLDYFGIPYEAHVVDDGHIKTKEQLWEEFRNIPRQNNIGGHKINFSESWKQRELLKQNIHI